MTTAVATATGRLYGLIAPNRSTARSAPAIRLSELLEQARWHLLTSFSVRRPAEMTLAELDQVREEASFEGWNGGAGRPVSREAYLNAKLFLELLPTTTPPPEISAAGDGDIALDWAFGERKALTVRVDAVGRCTFAWMRGRRTYRGTDWLDDGIPAPIVDALSQLARDARTAFTSGE
jgi:hypothetical protein